MQLKDIDLNLIVVFDAIYTERHLTRAGQRLHRTPSAMSHALNRLRALFNDPLFVREGNHMMPTSLADALSLKIEKGLKILRSTLPDHDEFDPANVVDTYILGIMDDCAFVVLPDLIPAIKTLAPGLEIKVQHIRYEDRPAAMERGHVDIIIGDRQEYGTNTKHQHLFSDRDVCIFRKGHPRISSKLGLDQYLGEEFIELYDSRKRNNPFDERIRRIERVRKVALRLEYEAMIPEIVSRTDYLANIAERNAQKFSRWVPIDIQPIPLPAYTYEIHQYWHTRNQQDACHQWLRQTIKVVCERM